MKWPQIWGQTPAGWGCSTLTGTRWTKLLVDAVETGGLDAIGLRRRIRAVTVAGRLVAGERQ